MTPDHPRSRQHRKVKGRRREWVRGRGGQSAGLHGLGSQETRPTAGRQLDTMRITTEARRIARPVTICWRWVAWGGGHGLIDPSPLKCREEGRRTVGSATYGALPYECRAAATDAVHDNGDVGQQTSFEEHGSMVFAAFGAIG